MKIGLQGNATIPAFPLLTNGANMPLDGVNKLCQQCKQTCKQYQQIKAINCPFYEFDPKTDGIPELTPFSPEQNFSNLTKAELF